MFKYPSDKLTTIVASEQHCIKCNRWFKLDDKVIKQLNKDVKKLNKPGFNMVPFRDAVCTHCGTKQIAIHPGKYDRPNSSKRSCSVQFVTTI